ncbi:MAG TPA: thioredoxin fold domain-containing protein, partial [Gammaproteobacteria bacterium]|nr:thioredoxin fold domain-containing protein [Gammaproteobacteria bacterium]
MKRWPMTFGGLLAVLLVGVAGPGAAVAEPESLEGGVNPGYHEPPAWFKASFLDLPEDVAEARDGGKRLMLYFYQDGCPYCAKLIDDNFGRSDIEQTARRNFEVVAINMWGDRQVTGLDGETR